MAACYVAGKFQKGPIESKRTQLETYVYWICKSTLQGIHTTSVLEAYWICTHFMKYRYRIIHHTFVLLKLEAHYCGIIIARMLLASCAMSLACLHKKCCKSLHVRLSSMLDNQKGGSCKLQLPAWASIATQWLHPSRDAFDRSCRITIAAEEMFFVSNTLSTWGGLHTAMRAVSQLGRGTATQEQGAGMGTGSGTGKERPTIRTGTEKVPYRLWLLAGEDGQVLMQACSKAAGCEANGQLS